MSIDKPGLRGLDDNSLWRLLDDAQKPIAETDITQVERARAEKAKDRICFELRKRGVRIRP
jgi:hypothetical protein